MSQENLIDWHKWGAGLSAPAEEEQTLLVLQGKCPHKNGWIYVARYGDDIEYVCKDCSEHKTI